MTTNDLKILAIDDNQDNLTTLRAVLSDRLPGATVLTALDGPRGLVLAESEDPDVILLDIVMPGMDGYEVCRKLKADARLQAIPVLFLTALRTDLASRVAAMDAGAEGFLPKPFDDIELVAQIRAMAKIKAAHRHRRLEKEELAALVTQRTVQLVQELAERRSAEKSLRASEERYRTVADFTHDWEYWLAPDGSLSYVSPSCERITGYRPEEFQRDPGLVNRIVHPDDRELVASHFGVKERIAADFALHEIEFRILTRDGEERWIGHVCRRVHGRAGEYLGRRASNRDITERRSAEADYMALFREMLNGFALHEIITDAQGQPIDYRFLVVNPAFERITGLKARDIIGRTGLEVIPGLEPLWIETYGRVALSGESLTFENYAQALGKYFEVRAFRPAPGRFACLFSDITERKRAEIERERLAVVIEQTAETVVITDTQGAILYVNPAFEAVTGYTRAEALGRNPRLLKSGVQDAAFYRELWATLASGRVWGGRLVNRKKDGSLYTEEATISPVRDAQGRIVSYVAVKRDITEHLLVHEEKSRLVDQLRQAQKIEAIGTLAGGVAHDFNNLTAIVLGYGEMLLDRLGPEDPSRTWVEQIVAAGKRSAALTRQLLAFSRKQTLQLEVLDLDALLQNFEKMLGRLIGEDIELEFKLAADLGRITADPGQIEQVVTNLVINSRDAMPLGGKLTIETAAVELDEAYARGHESLAPGRYVLLAVTDTGCGMDTATMDRLFEPFFSTKQKGKGTGLGLATVYGIVKQSGGYIYAYSELGKGTTFKIYLPLTDAKPAVKAAGAAGAATRGQGELILLVEDEAPLRELCETVLARLGYRVSAVGSGTEALRLVRERRVEPDMVITDVIMPVMSGAELVERLRKDRPGLRVLYMSGYPDEAIARHGVLAPGTPFIQKPFTERSLAAKVREVLEEPAATEKTVAQTAQKNANAPPGRRVLMIDDDEQFRELVRHFCAKRSHRFAGVDSAAAAIAALAAHPCDVILVDLNIPGTSGERVLREIRAAGHSAPAIVLTGALASADMAVLRPLGVTQALEKSSNAEPLLEAIVAAAGSMTTG